MSFEVTFVWTPGSGPDHVLLGRLRSRTSRPAAAIDEDDRALGPATLQWLVAKDRELSLGGAPVRAAPPDEIERLVEQIAFGARRAGPEPEHLAWLHYLLPFVVGHAHRRKGHTLLEPLVTAFVNCHWRGESSDDEVRAIGQSLMSPEIWHADGSVRARRLGYQILEGGQTDWRAPSPELSASLLFCLKYLPHDRLGDWVGSVCAITNHVFRAQWLQWLCGAWPFLQAGAPLDALLHTRPAIAWAFASQLCPKGGDPHGLLPSSNVLAFMDAVQSRLTASILATWTDALDETEAGQELRIMRVIDAVFDRVVIRP